MKLENSYDVVIVGAGPGGSITARDCARAGLKVLLLEKRPEIGAPKRCGECLSAGELKNLGFTYSEKFVMHKLDGAVFVAPNGKKKTFFSKGCLITVIERKLFDKWLAYDAAKAGAKVVSKAEAVDLIKNNGDVSGVIVDYNEERQNIKAKIVIAADGVESKIACLAGLNTTNNLRGIGSAYQYEMAGIGMEDYNKTYLYFGNTIAPEGFIWVIPKGKTIANVGIGILGNQKKSPKEYLDAWIETRPEIKRGSIIEVNSGGIPLCNFLKKMTLNNFMVVGDAAHQTDPIHGGGIYTATQAGKIAADVSIKAIKAGDTSEKMLDEYNKRWWADYGDELQDKIKYRRLFEKLSDNDFNTIFEAMEGEELENFATGHSEDVIKLIMKNPKIMMLARHLVQ